jgi:hypothetical protein
VGRSGYPRGCTLEGETGPVPGCFMHLLLRPIPTVPGIWACMCSLMTQFLLWLLLQDPTPSIWLVPRMSTPRLLVTHLSLVTANTRRSFGSQFNYFLSLFSGAGGNAFVQPIPCWSSGQSRTLYFVLPPA